MQSKVMVCGPVEASAGRVYYIHGVTSGSSVLSLTDGMVVPLSTFWIGIEMLVKSGVPVLINAWHDGKRSGFKVDYTGLAYARNQVVLSQPIKKAVYREVSEVNYCPSCDPAHRLLSFKERPSPTSCKCCGAS